MKVRRRKWFKSISIFSRYVEIILYPLIFNRDLLYAFFLISHAVKVPCPTYAPSNFATISTGKKERGIVIAFFPTVSNRARIMYALRCVYIMWQSSSIIF